MWKFVICSLLLAFLQFVHVELLEDIAREKRDADLNILDGLISVHAPSRKVVQIGVLGGGGAPSRSESGTATSGGLVSVSTGTGTSAGAGRPRAGTWRPATSSSSPSSSAESSGRPRTKTGRVQTSGTASSGGGTNVDVAGGLVSVKTPSWKPVRVNVLGAGGDNNLNNSNSSSSSSSSRVKPTTFSRTPKAKLIKEEEPMKKLKRTIRDR